ncbi:hypothetical protein BJV74DRAFT_554834 [Russula compacta]|nr:hypothetical protein BJV74DRAFT_554834 [Russula compacta]
MSRWKHVPRFNGLDGDDSFRDSLRVCLRHLHAHFITVLQIKWTQIAFVTQQEVSPSVFIEENINNWNYVLLNALYVIINWSADGILVFRFSCVFNRALQWNIFPVLLYLSSLVTGSLALHELATPGTSQDTDKLANWLVIYRTVSLSLCIILTSLITGRLIAVHRRSCPRPKGPNSPLMDIAIMLVESASLETVSTLAYVITVGIGSPLQNVFLPILGQVQVSVFAIEILFIPR